MRVIAGIYGGRLLRAPRGTGTRPTSDRVREAVFSMLGPLDGLSVLDLFAGSGALGIEALSRGAERATFVERDPGALACLKANLDALGIAAEVRRRDALAFLRDARAASRPYDLVLVDPPYRLAAGLGAALSEGLPAVLASGGRVVTESDRRAPLDIESLEQRVERRYGDTLIRILHSR
jgi:16S rRNA (guanine966-N2)-methyltransferase